MGNDATQQQQQQNNNSSKPSPQQPQGDSPGCTALMYACQQGDVTQVEKLLKINPALARDKDRTLKTALHYCAETKTAQCADLVYRAAPDLINAADEDGLTPLHLAVIAGNIPLTNFLLANNADVKALDNEKHSVVHWATVCGETAALRAVLLAGAPISTPDVHGGYPLHYAAQMCGVKDTVSTTDSRVESAGKDTSKLGLEVLDTLLTFPGIRINVEDADGRQPLLWAASAGSAAAVLALVAAGSAPEAADKDGLTALHCAASRGHTDCLEALLMMCGVSPDVIDSNGCTALHYAVTLGHADATALLLAHGAKVNRQDRKGRTPAHCGCAKGQVETVRMLGAHGADLWLRSARGDLPLHEAAGSGRRQLVRWLLAQRPSQVNAVNNDGRTPLHVAALNDNTDVCKILLDHGANVNAVMRTSKNILMTPLDCALRNGHRSTAKFLQLNGGLPFQRLRVPVPSSEINVHLQNDIIIRRTDQVPVDSDSDEFLSKHAKMQKRKVFKHRRKVKISEGEITVDSEPKDKIVQTELDSSSSHSSSASITIQPYRRIKTKTKEIQTDERFIIIPVMQPNQILTPATQKTNIETSDIKYSIVDLKSLTDSNFSDSNSLDQIKITEVLVHANQNGEGLIQDRLIIKEIIDEEKQESVTEKVESTAEETEASKPKEGVQEESTQEISSDTVKEQHVESETRQEELLQKDDQNKQESQPNEQKDEGAVQETQTEEGKDEKEVSEDKSVSIKERTDTEDTTEITVKEAPGQSEEQDQATLETKESAQEHDGANGDAELKVQDHILEKQETLHGISEIKADSKGEEEEQLPSTVGADDTNITKKEQQINNEDLEKIDSEKEKDSKNDEAKHEEAKNGATKDGETKDGETKNGETKDGDTKNVEIKDVETKDAETKDDATKDDETKDSDKTSEGLKTIVDQLLGQATHIMETPKEEAKTQEETEEQLKLEQEKEVTTNKKDTEDNAVPQVHMTEQSDTVDEYTEDSGTDRSFKSFQVLSNNAPRKPTLKRGKSEFHDDEGIELIDDENQKYTSRSHEDLSRTKVSKFDNNIEQKSNIGKSSKDKGSEYSINKEYTELNDEENNEINDVVSENLDKVPIEEQKKRLKPQKKPKLTDLIYSDESDLDQETYKKAEVRKRRAKARSKSAGKESYNSDSQMLDSGFEPSPRSSRIPRRKCSTKPQINMSTVTQSVQGNIRRYHLERKLFQHLLELKRLQIRSGQANEAVLVKRAIDDYHRSILSTVGAGRYTKNDLTFKSFEKFLYETLRKLQKSHVPHLDDLPEPSPPPLLCTRTTMKCDHATHAYTGIPCAAYITKLNHHTIPKIGFGVRPGGFLPKIRRDIPTERIISKGSVTLELTHGRDRQFVTLPTDRLDQNKKYFVTFTVKGQTDTDTPITDTPAHRHAKSC